MQTLRRWVPGTARTPASSPPPHAPVEAASRQDLAFCSELLAHGGVAVAEAGFKAEAELLRMRQAGLLDLERDQVPPFAVTRVALSQKARELVSRDGRARTDDSRNGGAGTGIRPAAPLDAKQARMLRRNGFEVARGLLNAAVKSEIAAWQAAGEPGGYRVLETRILTRITEIEVPFPV